MVDFTCARLLVAVIEADQHVALELISSFHFGLSSRKYDLDRGQAAHVKCVGINGSAWDEWIERASTQNRRFRV
jgi:hypothetical protein